MSRSFKLVKTVCGLFLCIAMNADVEILCNYHILFK